MRWILPGCSLIVVRRLSGEATSICLGPKRLGGISHQRSERTGRKPLYWWRWSWFLCRSSYRDRSWWTQFPSKLATWSLVCQTQSSQKKGCISACCSKLIDYNERCSNKQNQIIKMIFFPAWHLYLSEIWGREISALHEWKKKTSNQFSPSNFSWYSAFPLTIVRASLIFFEGAYFCFTRAM